MNKKATYASTAVNTSYSYTFSTFSYKGLVVDGTCPEWSDYAINQLSLPFAEDELYFSHISAYFENYDYNTKLKTFKKATCSTYRNGVPFADPINRNAIKNIISSLRTGKSYEFNCDSNSWRVFTCDSYPVLCVNCKHTCVPSAGCRGNAFTFNPCSECSYRKSAASYITFEYRRLRKFPWFTTSLEVESLSKTSVAVSVNVSSPGIIYCAALENPNVPSSTSSVKLSGFSTYNYLYNSSVAININNLVPDTLYNIYCYSEDFSNHAMDIASLLESKTEYRSPCCPSITFTKTYPLIVELTNSVEYKQFEFQLDTKPKARSLDVSVSVTSHPCTAVTMGTSKNFRLTSVIPSVFTFIANNTDLTRTFIVKGYFGCYTLLFLPTFDAGTSQVYVNNTLEVIIQNSNIYPPAAPKFKSIIFSDNGNTLLITYDKDTNMPVISGNNCTIILTFMGAENSMCYWKAANLLRISLGADSQFSSRYISAGDNITAVDGVVKAAYVSNTNFSTYPYTSSSITMSVSLPSPPLMPNIQLMTPTESNICSDLIIDPTYTTGSGGRPWIYIRWSVEALINGTDVDALERYLNMYVTNRFNSTLNLIKVPSSYFVPNTYYISLYVTNFLSYSSHGTVKVVKNTASLPTVTIAGPSRLTMYRWQPLTIYAIGEYPTCLKSDPKEVVELLYNWEVYKDGELILLYPSESKDSRAYMLSPFTISIVGSYIFQVTVTVKSSIGGSNAIGNIGMLQAKKFVSIDYGVSGVVAVIKGGSNRSVSKFSQLILDGSDSYDIDNPKSSELNYSWRCISYSPTYGIDCSSQYGIIFTDSKVITVNSGVLESGVTYYFSLTVRLNGTSTVSDITNQYVYIDDESVPLVSFKNINSKYNPLNKISLNGEITGTGTRDIYAQWSLVNQLDGSDIILTDIASTPVSITINKEFQSSLVFPLGIKSDTLDAGHTYTFKLSAYYGEDNIAYALVTVTMNSAPFGGLLSISPAQGVEMNTSFIFQTYSWSDEIEDYPIQYVFGYYTVVDNQDFNMIQPKMPVTSVYSYLSSGSKVNNYYLTGFVRAYDVYDSFDQSTHQVRVSPLATSGDSLNSLVNSFVNDGFALVDSNLVIQTIAAATKYVNNIDCTSTQCDVFNRYSCRSTPKTCGACFDGYIGISGDSNTLCSLPDDVLNVGDSCRTNSQCVTGICTLNKCAKAVKRCRNYCSFSGDCVYTQTFTGKTLDICYLDDVNCQAKCTCNAGSFGDDCSLSSSSFNSAVLVKESLCRALNNVVAIQNVDSNDIIYNRIYQLSELLSDISAMSDYGLLNCTEALITTVNSYKDTLAKYADTALMVSNVLSNIIERPSLSSSLLEVVISTLSTLSASSQISSVTDENSMVFVTDNIRLSSSVSSIVKISESTFSTALTDIEIFDNVQPTSTLKLSIDGVTNNVAIGVSLIQYLNNPKHYTSNTSIVGLKTDVYTTTEDSNGSYRRLSDRFLLDLSSLSMTFDLTIRQIFAKQYQSQPKVDVSFLCHRYKTNTFNYRCPDGTLIEGVCPGDSKGHYNYSCPAFEEIPICTYYSHDAGEFVENLDCIVSTYTEWTSTCTCNRNALSSRRLSSDYIISGKGNRANRLLLGQIDDDVWNTYNEIVEFSLSSKIVSQALKYEYFPYPIPLKAMPSTVVMSLLYSVAVLCIIGILLFMTLDYREFKVAGLDKKIDSKPTRTVNGFFSTLLPAQFHAGKWYHITWKWMLIEHPILCLLSPYSPTRDYRGAKWMVLVTKLVSYIFVSNVFTNLYYKDDGTCEAITSESACVTYQGLLNLRPSCQWSNYDDYCSYAPLNFTFLTIFGIIIVVTLIVVPINCALEFFINSVSAWIRELLTERYQKRKPLDESTLDRKKKNKKIEQSKNNRSKQANDGLKVSVKLDDEFADSISKQSKFWLAARLKKIQSNSDYALPSKECELLMQNTETDLSKYGRQNLIFSKDARDKWASSYTPRHSRYSVLAFGKGDVTQSIINVRRDTLTLKSALERIDSNEEKEDFIMRHFIISSFHGYKQSIVKRYMLNSSAYESAEMRYRKYVLRVLCLVGYFVAMIFMISYVVAYKDIIGTRSSDIWITTLALCILLDLGVLSTIKIWLKYAVITSHVSEDLRQLLVALNSRYYHIIYRTVGMMKDANCLIQHFNPACRLSRFFPNLPICRLLLSLNDYDTPFFTVKFPVGKEGSFNPVKTAVDYAMSRINYAFTIPLIFLNFFPYSLQDPLLEMVSSLLMNVSIIIMYLFGTASLSGLFICLTILIAVVCVREYIIYNEGNIRSLKLRKKFTKYVVDTSHRIKPPMFESLAPSDAGASSIMSSVIPSKRRIKVHAANFTDDNESFYSNIDQSHIVTNEPVIKPIPKGLNNLSLDVNIDHHSSIDGSVVLSSSPMKASPSVRFKPGLSPEKKGLIMNHILGPNSMKKIYAYNDDFTDNRGMNEQYPPRSPNPDAASVVSLVNSTLETLENKVKSELERFNESLDKVEISVRATSKRSRRRQKRVLVEDVDSNKDDNTQRPDTNNDVSTTIRKPLRRSSARRHQALPPLLVNGAKTAGPGAFLPSPIKPKSNDKDGIVDADEDIQISDFIGNRDSPIKSRMGGRKYIPENSVDDIPEELFKFNSSPKKDSRQFPLWH